MVYDVAIVGLGAMGSASVFELSRRGQRVVGFDAFAPPHSRASSHGETRLSVKPTLKTRSMYHWFSAHTNSGMTWNFAAGAHCSPQLVG